MISITYNDESQILIKLPQAARVEDRHDDQELVITINASGCFTHQPAER
jgi:biopolymer transport protein ExbD